MRCKAYKQLNESKFGLRARVLFIKVPIIRLSQKGLFLSLCKNVLWNLFSSLNRDSQSWTEKKEDLRSQSKVGKSRSEQALQVD